MIKEEWLKRDEYRKWYISIYLEFINIYNNTFSLMFGNILTFFIKI